MVLDQDISDTRFESADVDISMDFMKLHELNLQTKDRMILNFDFNDCT